jgi:CRISPR-associated RAMP protein (TIGR02581 family)
MFDKFESRLVIRGKILLRTGLHIGTQMSVDPIGSDLPVIRDRHRRPFIPGSSLKGVLRQCSERLLRALDVGAACDPILAGCLKHLPEKRRAWRDQKTEEAEIDDKSAEEIETTICIACRVFGSTERASKVLVRDALWSGDAVHRIEVRDGVGIDRDTGTAADGVKYDFEVVPLGSEFGLELVLENAADWERGLVFVALDELRRGYASLGGMTSRGLGRVAIDYDVIEEWDAQSVVRGAAKAVHSKSALQGDEAAPSVTSGPVDDPEMAALREILASGYPLSHQELMNKCGEAGITKKSLLGSGRYGSERKLWERLFERAAKEGILLMQANRYKAAPAVERPTTTESKEPSPIERFIAASRTALATRLAEISPKEHQDASGTV